MVRCGLAVSPGKPRVPHCEERPGAAHSRRDPECALVDGKPGENRRYHTGRSGREPHTAGGTKSRCGLAVSPGKPRVPHCEERPGAAYFRRDQVCVSGFSRKFHFVDGMCAVQWMEARSSSSPSTLTIKSTES